MNERDWVVAIVALGLGATLVWSSLVNHPFLFKLWLPRLLEGKFGRESARWALAAIGIGVITLGGVVVWQATSKAEVRFDSELSR